MRRLERNLWHKSMFLGQLKIYEPRPQPPFFGEWGHVDREGYLLGCGRLGPFQTVEEAFHAAAKAAREAGVTRMPTDGYAQVVDSHGQPAGPVT